MYVKLCYFTYANDSAARIEPTGLRRKAVILQGEPLV